jgi:lysophospholipase L1-like esterase
VVGVDLEESLTEKNRMKGSPLLLLSAFLGGLCPALAQVSGFVIHDGDRVTFYGDSITAQRLYTEDVEEYVITRFPNWSVEFHNAGVGGDRVSGGWAGPVDLRLDRDVFAWHPSIVTVMLGMNDFYGRASEPGIVSSYRQGYEHIVESLKKNLPQARITLIQPSPYDDITRPPDQAGFNTVLIQYGAIVSQMSKENGTLLVDFNEPLTTFLKALSQQSLALAEQLIPDRVHPQMGGHWIMAASLLKGWNAPALVSSVAFDLNSGDDRARTKNARVTNLIKDKSNLRWTEMEMALPLPFPPSQLDPVLALAIKETDLLSALDQETLQLRGLAPGQYELLIDGGRIGVFSERELGGGLNLATLDTPMRNQARLVAMDVQERNSLEDAWFNVVNPSAASESSPSAVALAASMPAAEAQVHADAHPRPHQFEIRLKN